jgi:capsular exopolysaccharide synthesis family protein
MEHHVSTSIIVPADRLPPTPVARPAPEQIMPDKIDPSVVTAFLRRRYPIILGVLLACLCLGVFITLRQTPIYLSTAQITLVPRVEQIAPVSDQDRANAQSNISEMYLDTQVDVITSAPNIAAVVDRFDLARDPRFRPDGVTEADARRFASDYVRSVATAYRPGATYSITIAVQSTNSQEAARIANALAEQYTSGTLDEKDAEDRRALAEISQRMDQARGQSVADAAALQRYRLANNLPSTNDKSLTEQEISAYNQQVTSARAEAAEDAARLTTARQQLGAGSSGDDVGESLGSPVISSLRQQQANYAAEVAALSSKYRPNHPDLVRARGQLAAINNQIREEIQRVVSNLSAKARVSQQRVASLTGSLNTSQGALRRQNVAMVSLQDYEQKAGASKDLYESYLTRYKEMAARIGIRQPEASILHYAEAAQRPTRPNMLLNLLFASALGFGLGLAAAVFTDRLSSGITSGDEIETKLGARYLCAIPELSSVVDRKDRTNPVDSVLDDPRTAFAESLRNLRASIAFAVERPKIIAMTSALPGEGKTTICLALGRSMAANHSAILLIDCDVRRRGTSRWLDSDPKTGLLEVLRGNARLEDAVVIDERSGLHILPLAAAGDDEHDLLTGGQMDALLAHASSLYDAVILDTAPVLAIADARLLLSKADASIVTVRWRKTPEAALRSALRMLPGEHVRLAGVVISRMDMRTQSRYGQDENAFYKAYKNYYA